VLLPPTKSPRRNAISAVSLPELIVVVAVLAIFAAIAVPSISGVFGGSQRNTAERNLNMLNAAVSAFNQANWELELAPAGGSSDESAIYRSLRYRAATNPSAGSPYLPISTRFVASSDSNTYRAQWDGDIFRLLPPGVTGTGIDLLEIHGMDLTPNATNTPIPPQ
jgi:prepilin-type N-terminal cleavage/methylation domain-containing protein